MKRNPNFSISISQLRPSERPRERCLNYGSSCLSLRECLAILIGSGPPQRGCLGLASQLLQRVGEGLSDSDEEKVFFTALESAGVSHLKGISGLGPSGQARIMAAFELGRRYTSFRWIRNQEYQSDYQACRGSDFSGGANSRLDKGQGQSKCHGCEPKGNKKYKITHAKNVMPAYAEKALLKITTSLRMESHEWFGFVPVYRNSLVGDLCISEKGSRTHVNLDPAELFARILALRPSGIFLFHNHPSGNDSPSEQDILLTKNIKQMSNQFGIEVWGHWIVTPQSNRWISS